MIPDAVMTHASQGRLRIRIPSKKGDEESLIFYRKQFAECPGIFSVEVNPVTGSMLFLHTTSIPAIAEYARSKSLFTVQEKLLNPGMKPSNLRQNITETFEGLDKKIQSMSDGAVDLGGFAFVVLVGAGMIQILAGNAAALPWYVAFGFAFTIFQVSKESVK